MTNIQILSVNKVGECINIEIGREEEAATAVTHEIGQIALQIIQQLYTPIKRRTKAIICLSEDEYEILKPAVGDEVEVEVTRNTITFKLNR
jgi:hypothetical protein